jgi:hypothetical protein
MRLRFREAVRSGADLNPSAEPGVLGKPPAKGMVLRPAGGSAGVEVGDDAVSGTNARHLD